VRKGCCDDCLCGCPLGYEAEGQLKAADEKLKAAEEALEKADSLAKAVREYRLERSHAVRSIHDEFRTGVTLREALAAYEKVRGIK
jgi:hypothetical protein